MEPVVVIDFETTGLSSDRGDRALVSFFPELPARQRTVSDASEALVTISELPTRQRTKTVSPRDFLLVSELPTRQRTTGRIGIMSKAYF